MFTPILRELNQKGLQWVAEVLDANPNFPKNYEPMDAVLDFRGRLEDVLSNDVCDVSNSTLDRIARTLDIIPKTFQSQ